MDLQFRPMIFHAGLSCSTAQMERTPFGQFVIPPQISHENLVKTSQSKVYGIIFTCIKYAKGLYLMDFLKFIVFSIFISYPFLSNIFPHFGHFHKTRQYPTVKLTVSRNNPLTS